MTTSERIVTEATRLFAEKGYTSTTITDIESAVGLSRGAGGIYRHFPSKRAILAAAIEAHMAGGDEIADASSTLPTGLPPDRRSALRAIGEIVLARLDQSRDVSVIYLRDPGTVTELVPEVVDQWLNQPYTTFGDWLARSAREVRCELPASSDSLAYAALSPLLLFRVIEWLTGDRPRGLTDEQLLDGFVETQHAVLAQLLPQGEEANG